MIPVALLALVAIMAIGAGALGASMAPGSATTASAGEAAPTGATTVPASPPTTVPPSATPSTLPGPPDPPAPGPLQADGAAWRGHGDLAFVSSGQLDVLSDDGTLAEVDGPTGGGFDSNPAWSPDGRWLAFLHTGPNQGFEVSAPTLWLVEAGASRATEVTVSGVGTFAWSPVAPVLAFTEAVPNEPSVAVSVDERVWLDQPGSTPISLDVGTGHGVGELAWSPDGTELAFDDSVGGQPASGTSPVVLPVARVGVLPAAGGPIQTAFQLTGSGLRLAGWWPDGEGLLFWEDPQNSASLAADGLVLYSLANGSSQPAALVESLVGPQWWAPAPQGNVIAVVAGAGREIWAEGRGVQLCALTTATCQTVSTPPGSVGLAPSWTASSDLLFATASATAPFGSIGGADYSPGYMSEWDATSVLWTSTPGGAPSELASSPAGALLASPATEGGAAVIVADNAVWLADTESGAPAVRIAGPLYSTSGPAGFYGEVDWSGTFAWSAATGARQDSVQLSDEALAEPESQIP